MADYQEIYREHADRYEALVAAEDHEGAIPRALAAILPLEGIAAVEVGAGTGRLTRILLEAGAARVRASEREPAMLERARAALAPYGDRLTLEVADARALEAPPGEADLAIAGWVFGHFRYWMPEGWREEIGGALDALTRALRPGGALVILETLGTGRAEAGPPNEALAEYYAWLEGERGLRRETIRTDYRFQSAEEAARITGFFFGEAMAERVRAEGWAIVPEHTGLWWRRRPE